MRHEQSKQQGEATAPQVEHISTLRTRLCIALRSSLAYFQGEDKTPLLKLCVHGAPEQTDVTETAGYVKNTLG